MRREIDEIIDGKVDNKIIKNSVRFCAIIYK